MAPDKTRSSPPVAFLPKRARRAGDTAAMRAALCVLLILLLGIPSALATSRIYSRIDQFIIGSDFIAVVILEKSNEDSMIKPRDSQGFGCASLARVERVIKGDPVESILIHHTSGRDDALFQKGPGSYLVFLKKQNDVHVPTDGWPSSKKIEDKRVAGWSDLHPFNKDYENLETAIEYIKAKGIETVKTAWGSGTSVGRYSRPRSRLYELDPDTYKKTADLDAPLVVTVLSTGRLVEGLEKIRDRMVDVRVNNPNPYPVFFQGRQYLDNKTIKPVWRALKDGEWKIVGWDWCGTGIRDWEIEPQGSIDLMLSLHPDLKEQRIYGRFYRVDQPATQSEYLLYEKP